MPRRELEQVVSSRERLHKENVALAAQLDRQQQQQQQQQHERRDSTVQRLRQSQQSLVVAHLSDYQIQLHMSSHIITYKS